MRNIEARIYEFEGRYSLAVRGDDFTVGCHSFGYKSLQGNHGELEFQSIKLDDIEEIADRIYAALDKISVRVIKREARNEN